MDWEKAKNVLIALFFILNVFLLALVVQAREETTPAVEKKVREILAQNNIAVLCEIPSETVVNKMLTYGDDGFDMKKIKNTLGDFAYVNEYGILFWEGFLPFDAKYADKEAFCKNIIKSMGLTWANFYLDEREGDDAEILFVGKFRNYLVFENYIKFTTNGDGVTKIEAAAKKIADISNGAQKIVSINAILIGLYDSINDVDIIAIEPGFINFAPGIDSTMRINDPLVWRIAFSTGASKMFRALDGALIE